MWKEIERRENVGWGKLWSKSQAAEEVPSLSSKSPFVEENHEIEWLGWRHVSHAKPQWCQLIFCLDSLINKKDHPHGFQVDSQE